MTKNLTAHLAHLLYKNLPLVVIHLLTES